MPKAALASGSTRPSLRRNQACLSCRKRKLKCDAARPHCTTCVKAWQALISVPPPIGYAHPTEPQCSYDPVEGLPIAPDIDPTERIRELEEQISQLKNQLHESRTYPSRSASPARRYAKAHRSGSSPANGESPGTSPLGNGVSLPRTAHDLRSTANGSSASPQSTYRGSSDSPDLPHVSKGDQFMDMLFSGWDPDLPDPATLNHYIEVFFKCDPCGSRVLHRPSFLASMDLHPKDPNFPHSAVLHAICASASRWASHDIATSPDGARRDRFADFHVGKTRAYIDKTMATGADIFPVMQACILLSWYFYQEGRWVEVWIFAGFQSRVAIPLRLNYPGTFSSQGGNAPGAFLPPPKDFLDLESRRRTWWMTIMFDRIVSVGGWLHSVDEKDIGTELPVRCSDFDSCSNIARNPQDLATTDLFTRHPAMYTDSYILFLKAVILFGRVTDHNTRSHLRTPNMAVKSQNPFLIPGFQDLDNLVSHEFLDSLPSSMKHLGVKDDGSLDTDLYMVHIVPHAATITLHNPFLDFHDSNNISITRCVNATRSILSAYYRLSETSLDISRLHPFVTVSGSWTCCKRLLLSTIWQICWYLAAVVQIQLCKYFIEINDTVRESTVWGEINVLRFAMLTYGTRSPVGTRQEKLLQGLMTEIVRMTSQPQPLEVGIPLYPFSHSGLFARNAALRSQDTGAPLPNATVYEDNSPITRSGITSISTPPMPHAGPRIGKGVGNGLSWGSSG
ncbi:hypothetical protein BXZ70DRAFT_928561 [Cristinia sonorae]|uniref:Zn(2)-C6 fungal-type domain-containing protein n=1 Tax=Cristinia sonorae TaxID=1940300 RepID=A0A8K0USN4_9AGAR|nr:hypothetical protein BXZ70DRAFT_928561 [Cristinia sonorae]